MQCNNEEDLIVLWDGEVTEPALCVHVDAAVLVARPHGVGVLVHGGGGAGALEPRHLVRVAVPPAKALRDPGGRWLVPRHPFLCLCLCLSLSLSAVVFLQSEMKQARTVAKGKETSPTTFCVFFAPEW